MLALLWLGEDRFDVWEGMEDWGGFCMANPRLKIFGSVLMLWSIAGVAGAQMEHPHQMEMGKQAGPSAMAKDSRQALGLSPAVQEGLKLTMREHMESLQAIVAALAQEDYEKAAAVAHEELGFPKHHQAMEREAGSTFPPKYHELAMAHHQEAEDLAKVLPSKDLKTILPKLETTIGACVSCHRAYKL